MGVQRTATTIPHMFLLPKRGGDFGDGSDKSWIVGYHTLLMVMARGSAKAKIEVNDRMTVMRNWAFNVLEQPYHICVCVIGLRTPYVLPTNGLSSPQSSGSALSAVPTRSLDACCYRDKNYLDATLLKTLLVLHHCSVQHQHIILFSFSFFSLYQLC